MSSMFSKRSFAAAAALALVLGAGEHAGADTASITGFALHCAHGVRTIDLSYVVKAVDGRRAFATPVNSDGSFVLVVDRAGTYDLFVYASGSQTALWQQRVSTGPQRTTICITGAS